MRGKDLAPTNFFEDENRLAYASIECEKPCTTYDGFNL